VERALLKGQEGEQTLAGQRQHEAPAWTCASDCLRPAATGLALRSAACDGGDHADLLGAGELRIEAAALAHVLAVDVDVHERAERAALVEEQARDRKRA
jgi:hypothetical protein